MKLALYIVKKIIKNDDHQNRLTKPVLNIAVWGIALGVLIMLMAVSVTTGYQKEIKQKLSAFNGDVQISNTGMDESLESAPARFDSAFYAKLKDDHNIQHTQIFAYKAGIIKTRENMHGIILKGVQKDFNWAHFKTHLVEGEAIDFPKEGIGSEAIISEKIAQLLKLKMGDKFRVFFVTRINKNGKEEVKQKKYAFTICGIYNTGLSEHFDSKMVLIDFKRIQKINQWNEESIGGYEVFFDSENFNQNYDQSAQGSLENYIAKENYLSNEYFEHLSFMDVKSIYSRFQQIMHWLEYINMHIYTILTIILVVSIVNMSSALLILILEKTNMIGILKALGAQNIAIRWVFVFQAAYLIAKGILWGNALAFAIAWLQNTFGFMKLDPETYYISQVYLNVDLGYWLAINVLTIVCCSLMLLIPSLVITKISPVKAIKFS